MKRRWRWFGLGAIAALLLSLALQPVQTLEVATVEGSRRWCAVVGPGEPVVYLSRNSIYRVPVAEYWTLEGQVIRVSRVDSAPIVLDYYGIVDYTVDAQGLASGDPRLSYPSLRIALTEQGQQRLRVGGQETTLADLAPDGTLTVHTRRPPRMLACRSSNTSD